MKLNFNAISSALLLSALAIIVPALGTSACGVHLKLKAPHSIPRYLPSIASFYQHIPPEKQQYKNRENSRILETIIAEKQRQALPIPICSCHCIWHTCKS